MSSGGRFPRQKQRGISLVIVIFLLAVVSVIALSMLNMSATQNMSSLYTARAAQAYFSARSGVQFASTRIATDANPVIACANVNGTTIAVQGFNVAINCAASAAFDEGDSTAPFRIYSLTATASGGTFQAQDVTNRQIQVSVWVPDP